MSMSRHSTRRRTENTSGGGGGAEGKGGRRGASSGTPYGKKAAIMSEGMRAGRSDSLLRYTQSVLARAAISPFSVRRISYMRRERVRRKSATQVLTVTESL